VAEFDILLPFYGPSDQFEEAVRSILAQSHGDFRLLCVDDHYPSLEPRDWLLSLGDPRIEYVRNDRNLGVAGNFSRCLELAEADWFVMMGGDDIMLPEYLATMSHLIQEHTDIDVIQPGVNAGRPSEGACPPANTRRVSSHRRRTHGRKPCTRGLGLLSVVAVANFDRP